MATGAGVSGLAVTAAAAGLLLVRSAVTNESPADTLRRVLGKPTQNRQISTPLGSVASGVRAIDAGAAGESVGRALGDVAGAVGNAGRFVAAARKYLGVKYRYGSTDPAKGLDCSGLVIVALRETGVKSVPRFTTVTFGAWASRKGAKRVGPDEFRIGDVICRPGHMAIATGRTTMIHAPRPGKTVTEADIYSLSTWWGWRFW